jgi:hypothetical protein
VNGRVQASFVNTMTEKKFITRIAIIYNPPTFKFEHTKGRCRDKYHKHVRLERYLDGSSSGAHNSIERSKDAISIVTAMAGRHEELRQVPEETMERVIEKLLTSHKSGLESYSDVASEQSHHEFSVIASGSKPAHELDDAQANEDIEGRVQRYEDLNEVSDEILSMAKKDMNVTFEKFLMLPENERYEYDKRIDFHPDEDSSWD